MKGERGGKDKEQKDYKKFIEFFVDGLGLEEKGWKRLKKGRLQKENEKRADLSDLV